MEISTLSKFRKILQKWYLPLIAGILFILIAIGIYSAPTLSISALMLMFSLTIIGFGIRETIFVISNRMFIKYWVWHLVSSILTILIGGVLLSNPINSIQYINAFVVILLFFKAMQNLVFHLSYSKRTQRTIGMNWIYSVALICIGLFLWTRPQIISTFLVTLSGLPFLIIGILSIALSITLRKTNQKLEAFKASFKEKTKDADYEIVE